MATFASALLDTFDKVCQRLDLELIVSRDYLDWYKKRLQREADFAKGLKELTAAPPGNSKAPPVLKMEKYTPLLIFLFLDFFLHTWDASHNHIGQCGRAC
jgi:hypothetical protein